MATDDRGATVTLQELLVASLVTADAVAELLMEKGIITEREFTNKLREKRGEYQTVVKNLQDAASRLKDH